MSLNPGSDSQVGQGALHSVSWCLHLAEGSRSTHLTGWLEALSHIRHAKHLTPHFRLRTPGNASCLGETSPGRFPLTVHPSTLTLSPSVAELGDTILTSMSMGSDRAQRVMAASSLVMTRTVLWILTETPAEPAMVKDLHFWGHWSDQQGGGNLSA